MNCSGSSSRPTYVVDSYALLAYLQGENGGERVRDLLRQARAGDSHVAMSLINLGEVLYLVERRGSLRLANETLGVIRALPVGMLPVTEETVPAAAHVKARHTISYADAFVVAAALECGGAMVTGDHEFHQIEGDVQIEWLTGASSRPQAPGGSG